MAGAVVACAGLPAAAARSLNDLARAKGLRFGAAVGRRDLDDPGYCGIVRGECGVVVAENDFKWPIIHPAPDRFDFAPA
ncbi:MAG: endo-1,4-beta-xylanase, partial [Pseudomonadota bacterium]